jgi:hypothetical protein
VEPAQVRSFERVLLHSGRRARRVFRRAQWLEFAPSRGPGKGLAKVLAVMRFLSNRWRVARVAIKEVRATARNVARRVVDGRMVDGGRFDVGKALHFEGLHIFNDSGAADLSFNGVAFVILVH